MSPIHSIHVLAVDDEPDICTLTKHFLESSEAMEVDAVCSVAEARTALGQRYYDAVVSDYQMPVEDGIQFLKSLREQGDSIPFILFTGKGREEVVIEALNNGADSYLQKGGNPAPQYAELEHRIRTVVQKHRSEEALRESEARFDRLAEHAGTIAWEVDADGLFTYVSHVSEAVWGYRPDELVGKKHFYDLHPISDRETFKKAVFAIFERKERFHDLVNPVQTKNDRTMWVTTDGIPLLHKDGTLRGYQGSDADITERKRAEGAVRMMNESVDGIALLGPDEKYWYLNRAHLRTYGYDSEEELLGRTWHCLYETKELDRFRRQIMPELSAQGAWRGEAMGRRKDGSLFPQELSLTITEGGRMICVVRDITERQRMEEALRKSEEKYRLLIESSHDIIYTVTPDGTFTFASPSWTALLGHPVDEVVGKKFQQFVHADDLDRCTSFLQRAADTGQRQSGIEYRVRHADGSWRWHTSNAVPIWDGAGTFVGLEGNARDITEQTLEILKLSGSNSRMHAAMVPHENGEPSHDILPEMVLTDIDAMLMVDMNGKIVRTGKEWESTHGFEGIGVGGSIFDIIHPDDLGRSRAWLSDSRNADFADELLNRLVAKDGTYLTLEWRQFVQGDAVCGYLIEVKSSEPIVDRMKDLVEASEDFLKESPGEMDPEFIAETVTKMSGAKMGAFNLYNDDGSEYTTVAIAITRRRPRTRGSSIHDKQDDFITERGRKFLGFDAIGKTWKHDTERAKKIEGRTITKFASLRALSGDIVPSPIMYLIERTFRTGEAAVIKIERDGHMLGDFTLIMPSGSKLANEDLVEIYSRLVGTMLIRRKTEKRLMELSERLSLATRAGGVGIWDLDVVNNKLTWDSQMFKLYGIQEGRFGGAYEAWKASLHTEDVQRGDEEIQMALRGEKEYDTEFRVLWPDGTIRHIQA
ncbi:MAG: PAS domain S-box protein, partial [Methanomassiliicoccales archaeon]